MKKIIREGKNGSTITITFAEKANHDTEDTVLNILITAYEERIKQIF